MRACLLVVLVLAVPVSAQPFAMDDPVGDVRVFAQGAPVTTAPYASADLVSFSITETAGAFNFTWEVDDMSANVEAPWAGSLNFHFQFRHRNQGYELGVFRLEEPSTVGGSARYESYLQAVDPSGDARPVEVEIALAEDTAANKLTASISRAVLVDEAGAEPFPGRVLDDLAARVRVREVTVLGALVVEDHLPDSGVWHTPYPVRLGGESSSGFRLVSDDPFRLSNGEAATFLFATHLFNDLDTERDFVMEVSSQPPAWDVRLPVPSGTMSAFSEQATPVAIRIPFAHEHGSTQETAIRVFDPADPTVQASVRLGIHFADVPQPSGHHNRVYLHSRADENHPLPDVDPVAVRIVYFNTLEEDPNDLGQPIRRGILNAPLSPALGVGLEIDEALQTSSHFIVQGGDMATPGAYVEGRVQYVAANGTVSDVFAIGPSDPMDVAPGATVVIEAPIARIDDRTRFEYERGAQLRLTMNLKSEPLAAGMHNPDAAFQPGSWFELPLLDYSDSLTQDFAQITSMRLAAPWTAKQLNPGSTAVFPWSLQNQGDATVQIRATLAGLNAEWARVMPQQAGLPPKTVVEGFVAITAPDDAIDGVRADLLLEIRDEHGSLLTLGRFVATVNTVDEVPDEASFLPDAPQKKSPSPAPLAALLALAWAARRRMA